MFLCLPVIRWRVQTSYLILFKLLIFKYYAQIYSTTVLPRVSNIKLLALVPSLCVGPSPHVLMSVTETKHLNTGTVHVDM